MPHTMEKPSARNAAVDVLRRAKHPLKTKEITERVLNRGAELKGKTPEATMAAILSIENLKREGLFERVAPGTYKLRGAQRRRARRTAAADEPTARERAAH